MNLVRHFSCNVATWLLLYCSSVKILIVYSKCFMWACTRVYETWQHKITTCLGKEYGPWFCKVESWELITFSNNWSCANKEWTDLSGTELLDPETMQGELRSTSVLDAMEEFPALDMVVGWGLRKWGWERMLDDLSYCTSSDSICWDFFLLAIMFSLLEAHWFTTDLHHKMLELVMVVHQVGVFFLIF